MLDSVAIIVNEYHLLINVIKDYIIEQGYGCDFIHWQDVSWSFSSDGAKSQMLSKYKAIYLDRLGEGTFSYLSQIKLYESMNEDCTIVNNPSSYIVSRDKALMALEFQRLNIPHPLTLVIHSLNDLSLQLKSKINEHFVVKSTQGFCANEVKIFHKSKIPYEFVEEIISRDKIIILQDYIENPGEFIWRIDIVDGEVIVANQRFKYNKKGKPICNGTRGGEIIFHSPSKLDHEVKKLALESCKKLNLSVAGVDIIKSASGKLFVIEVNPEPDITLDKYEFPKAIGNYLIGQIK